MIRIVLAGFVGGIVFYAWGMAAWVVLGLHDTTVQPLHDSISVTAALAELDLETGVYAVPMPQDPAEMGDPDSDYYKSHLAGPIYTVYFTKEGAEPMGRDVLIGGLVIAILTAMLAACLLTSALEGCRTYARRVGFVLGLGLFVSLSGHAMYWNWMRFPTAYTLAFIVDDVIGWTLVGLAIGAIVRPCKVAADGSANAVSSDAASPSLSANAPTSEAKRPLTGSGRNDAITLLATLQREARFVDIVKEPLAGYSDAQVGAATRDVLRDCGTVLERLFELVPVVDQTEGSDVDVPSGFDTGRFRVTGNAPSGDIPGDAPSRGSLVHHGWEARKCALPRWAGTADSANVVAPAELEIK